MRRNRRKGNRTNKRCWLRRWTDIAFPSSRLRHTRFAQLSVGLERLKTTREEHGIQKSALEFGKNMERYRITGTEEFGLECTILDLVYTCLIGREKGRREI